MFRVFRVPRTVRYYYSIIFRTVLRPTRVPPEIKTCNFVAAKRPLPRACCLTIDEMPIISSYADVATGTSRSHVKNCFTTGRCVVPERAQLRTAVVLPFVHSPRSTREQSKLFRHGEKLFSRRKSSVFRDTVRRRRKGVAAADYSLAASGTSSSVAFDVRQSDPYGVLGIVYDFSRNGFGNTSTLRDTSTKLDCRTFFSRGSTTVVLLFFEFITNFNE